MSLTFAANWRAIEARFSLENEAWDVRPVCRLAAKLSAADITEAVTAEDVDQEQVHTVETWRLKRRRIWQFDENRQRSAFVRFSCRSVFHHQRDCKTREIKGYRLSPLTATVAIWVSQL